MDEINEDLFPSFDCLYFEKFYSGHRFYFKHIFTRIFFMREEFMSMYGYIL